MAKCDATESIRTAVWWTATLVNYTLILCINYPGVTITIVTVCFLSLYIKSSWMSGQLGTKNRTFGHQKRGPSEQLGLIGI